MNWIQNLFQKRKRIFLDYASATPVLPEVKEVMERYWARDFHNPSAIYQEGVKVKLEIEKFRRIIAKITGTAKEGIIFTSGGTESDNLAILGVFEESKKALRPFRLALKVASRLESQAQGKSHIIISSIEHPAVEAAAAEARRGGGDVSVCEVDTSGVISLGTLEKLIKKNTVLVSIALANHEIGTIQPIAKIGRMVRKIRKKRGSIYPLLHTDASAAANFLPINLEALQADMLTLDASKIYGPKGIGALVLRSGVKIHPIIFGGSQEGGRRAGTLSTTLIAGFTRALEVAQRDREKESVRLESLRNYFLDIVTKNLSQTIINGSSDSHLPNIVSVSIPNTLSEFILLKLDKARVMVSVGSACSLDERVSGSPIIRDIGKPELADSTLRFSFGRFTTEKEVKLAAETLIKICKL